MSVETKTNKFEELMSEIKMVKEYDNDPDLSWLKTSYHWQGKKLIIDDSCRYTNEDVAEHGSKTVWCWIEDDHKRLQGFYNGEWHMIGIKASLTVTLNSASGVTREHKIESCGLWGVESDSGPEYFEEVFEEEKQSLIADVHELAAILAPIA